MGFIFASFAIRTSHRKQTGIINGMGSVRPNEENRPPNQPYLPWNGLPACTKPTESPPTL